MMPTHLLLSMVIPAHNEAENLPAVLDGLLTTLDEAAIPFEIIVVDDNSSDATPQVAETYGQRDPRVRLVRRTPPPGFGRAIRSGIEAVRGDVVIVYMADLSDHPEDAVRCFRKIADEGYDCVFGSRFTKGSHITDYPLRKLIANRIVNRMIQFIFWCPFNDLTNAFKAYRTSVLEDIGPCRASHFNITIELSLGALIRNYNCVQIPISWTGRTWGVSKLRMKEMGRKYLSVLIRAFAEKMLISDDLMAERLARKVQRERAIAEIHSRLTAVEARLDHLEGRPSDT